jgi:hypothetical protein
MKSPMHPILALLPPQSATIIAALAVHTIGTVVAACAVGAVGAICT